MFNNKKYWAVLLMMSGISASVIALDDPTEPPFRPILDNMVIEDKEVISIFTLSSILISPNRRVAVINGQILKRNELIEGARVIAIEPDRVLLDNAGKKMELFLLSDVKRKAAGISKL